MAHFAQLLEKDEVPLFKLGRLLVLRGPWEPEASCPVGHHVALHQQLISQRVVPKPHLSVAKLRFWGFSMHSGGTHGIRSTNTDQEKGRETKPHHVKHCHAQTLFLGLMVHRDLNPPIEKIVKVDSEAGDINVLFGVATRNCVTVGTEAIVMWCGTRDPDDFLKTIMLGPSDILKFHLHTHGDSILSKMNAMREDRRFCDVTLLLGGPQDTTAQPLRFHAHRVVLAASSDFLRDQFLLHKSQTDLSLGVVSGVEVGKRLLLSCYTGVLEVPLRQLVDYLIAASALQMSQVVENCSQAVSQYFSPTLAFLKLERPSEEKKEILLPDSGWSGPRSKNQEERDAAQPSTSIQEMSTEGGGVIVIQSKLKVSQAAKMDNCGLREVREDRKIVKAKTESSEHAACRFTTLQPVEDGGVLAVHTNRPHYPALRCNQHPPTAAQDHASSTIIGSSAQHEELVASSQKPDEILSVAAQEQKCGEFTDSNISSLSRAHLSKSPRSGDEPTADPGSTLIQRPYLCRRCDRVFQHLESYVGHLKEHRQYLCLVCGKGFSRKSHLCRHIRIHTGVKPYRCPLCHKTFSQRAPLQDHLNLHTGDRPHRCNYCAVHFAQKPGLRRHLTHIHGKSSLENKLEETVD
ncbi:hypothetical protein INR49_015172 [Caranx melampygus]|nr:hypothetical protein INR49_015172 [Caranx melampygus]